MAMFKKYYGVALFLILGLILPILSNSPRLILIGNIVFYYMILALSWNLIMGYTGIFSFGHMASVLIGGYTAALLVLKLDLSPVMGLLAGGIMAAFANFILGILCLRFRGFYLTLVTWAFSEMTITVLNNQYKFTGGSMGLAVKGIFSSGTGSRPYFYLGLGITTVFLLMLVFLINSKVGIYLKSIRDDESASEVMGVNTTWWKIFAFTLSGFWAGIAGVFYLNFMGAIDPTVGNLMELGNVMLMVIVGGIGSIIGPVLGSIFVASASQLLAGSLESMSMLIFALLMIVTLRYFRGGIVSGIERLKSILVSRGYLSFSQLKK